MRQINFTDKLINWYNQNKRDLPWRKTSDPYVVWVSEIILQQTKIEQGLPYFKKFIIKFPNIKALAQAEVDDLMRIWQGLGYYSRALNMHKTAKIVLDKYSGIFPRSYEILIGLPGIGDYTASAISSICNGEYKIVVDGNVMRFFSRLFKLDYQVNSLVLKRNIKKIGSELIIKSKPGDFNQALMDYGSLICTPKKYQCLNCIFLNDCLAFKNDLIESLPRKKKSIKIKNRYFNYLVGISKSKKVKILKRLKKDIWQNLYEFPMIETNEIINHHQADKLFAKISSFSKEKLTKELIVKHKLSHQNLIIKFWIFKSDYEDKSFVKLTSLESYAFPKPIFNVISQIQ